jgi:integrase
MSFSRACAPRRRPPLWQTCGTSARRAARASVAVYRPRYRRGPRRRIPGAAPRRIAAFQGSEDREERASRHPAGECSRRAVHSSHTTNRIRTELGLSGEPDLVFCGPDGTPWDPDRFSSAFAYQVAKPGLPRLSLQELRHSYSSMSQRAGTPLTTTSQSMGHSTTILTGDRYSHAVLEDFRAAADRIDRTYRAASSAAK